MTFIHIATDNDSRAELGLEPTRTHIAVPSSDNEPYFDVSAEVDYKREQVAERDRWYAMEHPEEFV